MQILYYAYLSVILQYQIICGSTVVKCSRLWDILLLVTVSIQYLVFQDTGSRNPE